MSNATTTAPSQSKKWYIRFNKNSGKILSIGPRQFVTTNEDEEVTASTNSICKHLITGKKKINKYAFSGGQPDIDEHRKIGGNPDIDVSYQYLRIFFEPDDNKLKKIYDDYKSGKMLTGELKSILIEKINEFLSVHQQKREEARKNIDEYLLKD